MKQTLINSQIEKPTKVYQLNNDGTFKLVTLNTTTYTPFKEFMMIVNDSGTYNYTYIYDESVLVARINPNGDKWFYHSDHLGSTTLITNESGDIVENTFYLPYGGIDSGGTQEIKLYEGKELDSGTGQYYYGARYYDPEKRIFIQPDSIIPNIYDPQQLNIYAFERNNPYTYIDPTGNFAVQIDLGSSFAGYNVIYSRSGGFALALDPRTGIAQIGGVSSTSIGIGVGLGVSVGPSITLYKSATTISDLSGSKKSVGGTLAIEGIGGTIDVSKEALTVGYAPGLEAEIHLSETVTQVITLFEFDPVEEISNFIENVIESIGGIFGGWH